MSCSIRKALGAFSNHYANKWMPEDATLLRKLFKTNAENSKSTNCLPGSIRIPGFVLGVFSTAVAGGDAVLYAGRGLLRFSVKALNMKFHKAVTVLCKDEWSAIKCTAMIIGNLAYATLGLLFGAAIFSKFTPQENKSPSSAEKIATLNTQLTNEREQCDRQVSLLSSRVQETEGQLQAVARKQKNTESQRTASLSGSRLGASLSASQFFEMDKENEEREKIREEFKDLGLEPEEFDEVVEAPEEERYTVSVLNTANHIMNGVAGGALNILSTGAKALRECVKVGVYGQEELERRRKAGEWKDSRYAGIIRNLIRVIGMPEIEKLIKAASTLSKLNGINGMFGRDLEKALKVLVATNSADPRTQYHAFVQHYRAVVMYLEKNINLPANLRKKLDHVCYLWFTQLPIMTASVEFVGKAGDPTLEKALSEESLSQALEKTAGGIKEAKDEFKAPPRDLNLAKLKTLLNNFDPLIYTNAPSQLYTATYGKSAGAVEERKTIIHMRTGVPIKGSEISTGPLREWEIEDPMYPQNRIRIVPEFLAFLRSLKDKKQKLLMGLHLDPAYYNIATKECKKSPSYAAISKEIQSSNRLTLPFKLLKHIVNGTGQYFDLQKHRESYWIKLLIQLSESAEFKDVLTVSLLPMDGEFLDNFKKIASHTTKKQFVDALVENVAKQDSLFILPGVLDKRAFATEACKTISEEYFKNYPNDRIMSLQDLQAFYGFFINFTMERLQFINGADVVQRNCKDAADRTMALVGGELCERLSRLDRAYGLSEGEISRTQRQIALTTFAPALNILKRPMLSGRAEILYAQVKHLEKEKKADGIGGVHTVGGYQLMKLDMPQDPLQSTELHPSGAAAQNPNVSVSTTQ